MRRAFSTYWHYRPIQYARGLPCPGLDFLGLFLGLSSSKSEPQMPWAGSRSRCVFSLIQKSTDIVRIIIFWLIDIKAVQNCSVIQPTAFISLLQAGKTYTINWPIFRPHKHRVNACRYPDWGVFRKNSNSAQSVPDNREEAGCYKIALFPRNFLWKLRDISVNF